MSEEAPRRAKNPRNLGDGDLYGRVALAMSASQALDAYSQFAAAMAGAA